MNPYADPKDHIFKFYSDPAHGWLEMPSKLVKELNLGICQISEFSYYDKKTDFVYIEQDCDLLNVKCPTIDNETEVYRNSQDIINKFINRKLSIICLNLF